MQLTLRDDLFGGAGECCLWSHSVRNVKLTSRPPDRGHSPVSAPPLPVRQLPAVGDHLPGLLLLLLSHLVRLLGLPVHLAVLHSLRLWPQFTQTQSDLNMVSQQSHPVPLNRVFVLKPLKQLDRLLIQVLADLSDLADCAELCQVQEALDMVRRGAETRGKQIPHRLFRLR